MNCKNILSGKSSSRHDALIQTITNYLRSGKRTGPMAEKKHQNKQKETEKLICFAKQKLLHFIDTVFYIKPDIVWKYMRYSFST